MNTPTASARLARAARLVACVALAFAGLSQTACQQPTAPADPHDLVVAITPPLGPFTAGETITWSVTVTNHSSGESGAVKLNDATGATCAAAGNTTCPSSATPNDVDNIPAGGRLTFTFTRTLPADGLGVQDISFSVSSELDTDPTNDSVSQTVTIDESRNGSYRVFSGDGRTYDLTLDFTHATWAIVGNGADATGTLSSELVDGAPVYLLGNGGRFRTVVWGLAGEADLGAGTASFMGSRLFATGLYFLNNLTFNVAARDWNSGLVSTAIETVFLNTSTMTRCTDATAYTLADCPSASKSTYTVSALDADFTAVNDAAPDDVIHFRLAEVGSTFYFVRAEADATGGRHFRLGIPDNAGPAAATYWGGDTQGHWNTVAVAANGTWTLSRTAPDDTGTGDTATFTTIGATAPAGLRLATRASDGGSLYFATADLIGFTVGTPAGPSAGYLMILSR